MGIYLCLLYIYADLLTMAGPMIFINVETTGFFSKKPNLKAEICQIAALDHAGERQFCEYILPCSTGFHRKASERSGFTLSYADGERVLLLNGQPIETVCEEEVAIHRFVEHISDTTANAVIAIGYSSDTHDKCFIQSAFKRHGVQLNLPVYIIDVLPFLRKVKKMKIPFGEKLASSENLKRQTLHRHLFGETPYNSLPTHDAVRDVKQLKDIITHKDFPFYLLIEYVIATIASESPVGSNPEVQEESSPPTENTGNEYPPKPRRRKRKHFTSESQNDENSALENLKKKKTS